LQYSLRPSIFEPFPLSAVFLVLAMTSSPRDEFVFLRRAIALSLLLHGLLLLQSDMGMASHPPVVHPLEAVLQPRAGVSARTPPAVMPRRPEFRAPALMPSAVESGVPAVTPAVDMAETGTLTLPRQEPSREAVARSSRTENASGVDFAEAKKSYLFSLAAAARRAKTYPPRAVAAGWGGTVEIHVVVAGGKALPPQLQLSSGHAELDSAALALAGTALDRTPLPESLHGSAFEFVLPISFSIDSE
jgi:protein TonB